MKICIKLKISVVTVVFNAVESIEWTLKSIASQSADNIELIVIDGKSTDGTFEILEKYKCLIDEFISEPDDGLYYAMNKGKNIATGDFIFFMNAGDVFCNDSVLNKIAYLMDGKEVLYYGNTIINYGSRFRFAPLKHHQSIFFPKSFCSNEDYNADKYKVIAESDYIQRASKLYPQVHLDVDIILSKLEGWGILSYSKFYWIKRIYQEMIELENEQNGIIGLRIKFSIILRLLVKYMAFKIGGLNLVSFLTMNRYKRVPSYRRMSQS